MKAVLYKLLMLEESHLARWAGVYALVSVLLGLGAMIGSGVLYLSMTDTARQAVPEIRTLSQELAAAGAAPKKGAGDLMGASAMLANYASMVEQAPGILCILIAAAGLVMLNQGLLYFRLYELSRRDA